MRIAVAQICSSTDPGENLELIRSALPDADGADLVVFPEATMASFARRSAEVAEPLDGPFADGVRAVAAQFGTTIAVGMFTPRSAVGAHGRCRNTLLVTGPGGEAAYHKLHLFDAFGFAESEHIEPGDRPVAVVVAGVTVGLAICYDVRFPELFKEYARAGAAVVLVPASWQGGPGKVDQWRTLVRARALDATSFVVACGQAEPAASGRPGGPGPLGVGHSLVVAPDGVVLHEAGAGPETFVVDLDPDAVAEVRRKLPVLANSRFVSRLRP
ncbi:MAG: carbon-nitrogen hydrolase family protein [Propionibacterium sp.]|nr:carbon-nitrogen hydrolase family protein [Propionibacterium sp.]